jgi:hypothetical protein
MKDEILERMSQQYAEHIVDIVNNGIPGQLTMKLMLKNFYHEIIIEKNIERTHNKNGSQQSS